MISGPTQLASGDSLGTRERVVYIKVKCQTIHMGLFTMLQESPKYRYFKQIL